MKKGRHRRFEEARKLKQTGPEFLFSDAPSADRDGDAAGDDDPYAEIAARYGAFDDEDDADDEDEA